MATNSQLHMNINNIGVHDIKHLISEMAREVYNSEQASASAMRIMDACLELFEKDYKFSVVNNNRGNLCGSYPSKIVLLECEKLEADENEDLTQQFYVLSDLFKKSRFARCRSRFVVPVILYKGKTICRSATIATAAEVYGRSSADLLYTGGESVPTKPGSVLKSVTSSQLCDSVRAIDVFLLEKLGVGYVLDLMVEERKVKYLLNVSSSEKVDKKRRYDKFSLWSIPYPGCEFFRTWRDKDYDGEQCYFEWEQAFVNAKLHIPRKKKCLRGLDIKWSNYKQWHLVNLTQNYLKVLLNVLKNGEDGILIHCISGWDRTPLFVSLLRLSLWADGVVHRSLSASQILFLTIAYDWYLFGHNLPDRLTKGEEIFFFCFDFLKHICDESFTGTSSDCQHSGLSGVTTDDSTSSSDSSWCSCNENQEEAVKSEWHSSGQHMLEEEIASTFAVQFADEYEFVPNVSPCNDDRMADPKLADPELSTENLLLLQEELERTLDEQSDEVHTFPQHFSSRNEEGRAGSQLAYPKLEAKSLQLLQEELQLTNEAFGSCKTSKTLTSSSGRSAKDSIAPFSYYVLDTKNCAGLTLPSLMPPKVKEPNRSVQVDRHVRLQQVRTYFLEAYQDAVGSASKINPSKAPASSSEVASANAAKPTSSSDSIGGAFSAISNLFRWNGHRER